MTTIPPFTADSAHRKVKIAQDLWNTREPSRVVKVYTAGSVWRNRDDFFAGSEAIEAFLTKKWQSEFNYILRKELFAFSDNKIAVQFWYENTLTPDLEGQWYRTYGLEHWVFDLDGKMMSRQMSGNTIPIASEDRWFKDSASVDEIVIPEGHMSHMQDS